MIFSPDGKKRFIVFLKAGLPYTLAGVVVVFGGLKGLQYFWGDSEYLTVIMFAWLALFWFIYQPLFRNRILQVKKQYEERVPDAGAVSTTDGKPTVTKKTALKKQKTKESNIKKAVLLAVVVSAVL